MGNSQYVLYAHLKPYSVTIQVGDVVTEGQKLGLLGNTGNATGPHLHFQAMDRPSALKTNGLPFVFDCFVLSSTVMDSIDETIWVKTIWVRRNNPHLPRCFCSLGVVSSV